MPLNTGFTREYTLRDGLRPMLPSYTHIDQTTRYETGLGSRFTHHCFKKRSELLRMLTMRCIASAFLVSQTKLGLGPSMVPPSPPFDHRMEGPDFGVMSRQGISNT